MRSKYLRFEVYKYLSPKLLFQKFLLLSRQESLYLTQLSFFPKDLRILATKYVCLPTFHNLCNFANLILIDVCFDKLIP